MSDNKPKEYKIASSVEVEPMQNSFITRHLKSYGVQESDIHGRNLTGDNIKQGFEDYRIVWYGVPVENSPCVTRMHAWDEGQEYYIWQVQIYFGREEPKEIYDPHIYALWDEELEDFTVADILGPLDRMEQNIDEEWLKEGRKLLLKIYDRYKDPRGGDRRPPEQRRSDDQLKQFTRLVNELWKPFWEKIKNYYNGMPHRYLNNGERWLEEIKAWAEIIPLLRRYKVSDELLLRVLDSSLSDRDKEPKELACFHAARLLHYPENLSVETLRGDYDKGVDILERDTPTR